MITRLGNARRICPAVACRDGVGPWRMRTSRQSTWATLLMQQSLVSLMDMEAGGVLATANIPLQRIQRNIQLHSQHRTPRTLQEMFSRSHSACAVLL